LKYEQFKHDKITVPEDLREFSRRPDAYAEFAKTVKNIFVEYDDTHGHLSISTFADQAIKRAHILSDMFFKDTRQKQQLLQRAEEASRLLQSTAIQAKHTEEFQVPFDLMGLAIGSHGANIQNARSIPGIDDIQLIESDGHSPCIFKVSPFSPFPI
jgi:hypothetical protein